MKNALLFLLALIVLPTVATPPSASRPQVSPDPTIPTGSLSAVLRRALPASSRVSLHALVVGASEEGVALIGATPRAASIVRKGSALAESVEGVRVTAQVKSVSPKGVELADGDVGDRLFLPGSFTPLAAPTNCPPEFLRHLESEAVPIDRLMRLIADQTGVNVSASDATAKKTVSIFLRNISAEAAVEEICRATGLWFRRDPSGGVIRITTMEEYSANLSSFREEMTRSFTLLYPNVVEIASVIYGLYPDRTLLSLGEEEVLEDDEYDLSRRFRRFRVLEENGNSQFMEIKAPQSASSGSRSSGNDFSFSRGNAFSRLSQWDRLRQRARIGGQGAYAAPDEMLSAEMAKRLNVAERQGDTNAYETVYGKNANGAANVFVSMSRKNNMLIVRTSDVKVMDEISRLVKELDVPTPMVLLEMKILELQLDDNFNAKFEWNFNGYTGDETFSSDANVFSEISQTAVMNSFTPTFAFKVISHDVLTKIELLAKDGKIKTLATPTLLVANNEVSRIFSGKEYPLVSGWTAGETTETVLGQDKRVEPIVEIEKKDVGDMLLISPNINADKTITLRLMQENSTVNTDGAMIPVSSGRGEEKKIDYVESRSLTGTFVANDGMTVMTGGLIKDTVSDQYYRTPILGSIPLLGFLFRGTEKVRERTEMIILIRPHVIMTPYEGGKISERLLHKLSNHPAADKPLKPHTLKDDLKSLIH